MGRSPCGVRKTLLMINAKNLIMIEHTVTVLYLYPSRTIGGAFGAVTAALTNPRKHFTSLRQVGSLHHWRHFTRQVGSLISGEATGFSPAF